MAQTIALETDDRGVTTLTLNRPDRHNALSAAMMDELHAAAGRLGRDPAVRVVVLTGAGESFCAGGDLEWMRAQMAADGPARAREARRLAEMLGALNEMPKPLIGRVQGQAFGGGIGLMAVCDVAIGVQGARFGLSETRLGLIPATIGPYVLARIGESGARRVGLSGRRFDAGEAAALGLIGRAVAPDGLAAAVEAEAAAYLSAAPGAVAHAKRFVRRLGPRIDEAVIADSIDALVTQWDTAEAAEGIAAFFEGRRPRWAE